MRRRWRFSAPPRRGKSGSPGWPSLEANGYPCYTTSAGWLGYSSEKLARLAQEAVDAGFTHIKMKVGRDLEDDIRRLDIVRRIMGPDRLLLIDANQVWEVEQAIETGCRELKPFNPYFIEEPTSPDDVEGHRKIREAVAPVRVATGEMCQNRILFKQFMTRRRHRHRADRCLPHWRAPTRCWRFLVMAAKSQAAGLAARRGRRPLRICAAPLDDRLPRGIGDERGPGDRNNVDHLHEHFFVHPCVIRNAAYMPPTATEASRSR